MVVSFRLNRDVHRIAGKKNPDAKVGIREFMETARLRSWWERA